MPVLVDRRTDVEEMLHELARAFSPDVGHAPGSERATALYLETIAETHRKELHRIIIMAWRWGTQAAVAMTHAELNELGRQLEQQSPGRLLASLLAPLGDEG